MESAELISILREVRDHVRARHPQVDASGSIPLADLRPLIEARDEALGKVAFIGRVNPRRGGAANGFIQTWKRGVARLLGWHVRGQVLFNNSIMECLDAAIEALNEHNRGLMEMNARLAAVQEEAAGWRRLAEERQAEIEELKDIRRYWAEWRAGWEVKLKETEAHYLRNVAEFHAAFQHRVTLMDANFRDTVRGQHAEFMAAMEKSNGEFWAHLEKARLEYERMIHSELRLVRQRMTLESNAAPQTAAVSPRLDFDYGRFAERFRGSEEYVKSGQQIYLPYFRGRHNVLDIGCGRGEFLELLSADGVPAHGIDASAESVALCRAKGLAAEAADLFSYLAAQPEQSLDGIFCAQVIEHLPPERLPEMIRLAASRLEPGGIIAIETPNPECLAIFATHFYLDPTHTRPVPYPLLVFYLEEAGIGGIEVKKLAPASDSMPALSELPAGFRDAFFGGLDYAVIGRKL